MSTIATLTTRFTADTKGFHRGLGQMRAGMAAAEGGVGGFSKVVELGVAGAAVGAGVALFKLGQKFEASSNTIRRETGATGQRLDELNESVKRVYATRPESLQQVTDTIAVLNRQSGATGPTLENLARTNLRLASITREELAPQLKATQGLMNNWGITADQQGPKLDVLYRTFQKTGVGVTDLATTMSSQGVILRQLGLSYEDSAGLLGLLSKSGVNASQMQMGFNKVIVEAAKAGIPARDMFRQIFDRIRNAPSETEAAGAAVDVFGARAGPRLAGLIREGKLSFDDLSKTIAGGSDTIDKAARDTATGAGRMKIAWHNLEVAVEPIATAMVEAFADAAKVILDVLNALGPAAKPVIMGIIGLLGTLGVAFKLAGVAATIFGVTVGAAFLPVTGIIIAIGLLAAGIYFLVTKFDWGWNAIKTIFMLTFGIVGFPVIAFIWMKDKIIGILEDLWEGVKAGFNWLIDFVKSLPGYIAEGFEATVEFFASLPGKILTALGDAGSWLVEAGRNVLKGLKDGAEWFFLNVFIPWVLLWPFKILDLLVEAAIWLVPKGRDLLRGLWSGMVAGAEAVWQWLRDLPGRIWSLVTGIATWLFEAGKSLLRGMWNGLVAGAEALWQFFRDLPGRIWSFVTGAPGWLLDTGRKIIQGLVNGFVEWVKWAWDFWTAFPGRLWNLVKDAGSWLIDVGRKVIEGFIKGVGDMAEKAGEKVVDVLKSPIEKAGKALGVKSPSTVMMAMGRDVGLGFVLGMERMVPAVAGAAAELGAAAAQIGPVAGPTVAAPAAAPVEVPALAAIEAPEVQAPETGPLEAFAAVAQAAYAGAGEAALGYLAVLEVVGAGHTEALAAMQSATGAFVESQRASWSALSVGVQEIVVTMAAALIATFTSLSATLQAIVAALAATLRAIWSGLVGFFGITTAAMVLGVVAAFASMSAQTQAITSALAAALRVTWQAFALAMVFNTTWMRDQMVATFTDLRGRVDQISKEMAARFAETMHAMVRAATEGAFNSSFQMQYHLRSAGPPITEIVRGYARSLRDSLNPILSGIGKDKISLPFAAGGRVPGTRGVRDSVNAQLTPGEFVIPARAAARIGIETLEKMRGGWLPLTSQYQGGGQVQPQVVAAANHLMQQFPGLRATSWFRPGGTSFHGRGQAVDLASGMGKGNPMQQASKYINESGIWQQLAEGIHNSLGGLPGSDLSVYRGKQVGAGLWGGGTWSGHADHIHLALEGPFSAKGGKFMITEAVKLPEVPKVDKGGEWFGGTARKLMEHVRKVADEWVQENTMLMETFSGPDGTAAPEGTVKDWILTALRYMKKPESWLGALYGRAMQESGGNPRAINLWDSNAKAGIPSKGLFQTIDPTFQAHRDKSLPNDVYHPIANTVAAINYMLARYGGPVASNGRGYALGGIVPATAGGRNILAGEGGRDEAVIPLPAGWRAMFAGPRADSLTPGAGARQAPAVNIEHYEVRENADHRRIFAMAAFEERAGRI